MKAKPTINVMFAGSVDDGKSTLIGRFLYDNNKVKDDVLESIARDSKNYGNEGTPDWALVADGLKSEREQGITIDVAHIYTETDNAYLHILDCPGHVEYTNNMVVAASMADIAVVLVDASHGPTGQTLRHLNLIYMMQVPRIILVWSKCDLINWDLDKLQKEYLPKIDVWSRENHHLSADDLLFDEIAISAKEGAGIDTLNDALVRAMESILVHDSNYEGNHILVCDGIHFDGIKRLYNVTSLTGGIDAGDVWWTNQRTEQKFRITDVITTVPDPEEPGELKLPEGQYCIEINSDQDMQRGDILCEMPLPSMNEEIKAKLLWLAKTPFDPEGQYCLKGAGVTGDPDLWIDEGADMISQYQLADVRFSTSGKIQAVVSYGEFKRKLGRFLIVDKVTNATVGCLLLSRNCSSTLCKSKT